jgi:hypothetical protein
MKNLSAQYIYPVIKDIFKLKRYDLSEISSNHYQYVHTL